MVTLNITFLSNHFDITLVNSLFDISHCEIKHFFIEKNLNCFVFNLNTKIVIRTPTSISSVINFIFMLSQFINM